MILQGKVQEQIGSPAFKVPGELIGSLACNEPGELVGSLKSSGELVGSLKRANLLIRQAADFELSFRY